MSISFISQNTITTRIANLNFAELFFEVKLDMLSKENTLKVEFVSLRGV